MSQGYLLDTALLLETIKPSPHTGVMLWMESVPQDQFYISAVTIGEIVASLERVADANRRVELMRWVLQDLQGWFRGHVLTLTPEVAAFWGSLAARMGRDISPLAGLQAAFALKHNLTFVTPEALNIPHLSLENPWG